MNVSEFVYCAMDIEYKKKNNMDWIWTQVNFATAV